MLRGLALRKIAQNSDRFSTLRFVRQIVGETQSAGEPSIGFLSLDRRFLMRRLQVRANSIDLALNLEHRDQGFTDCADVRARGLQGDVADLARRPVQESSDDSEAVVQVTEVIHEI